MGDVLRLQSFRDSRRRGKHSRRTIQGEQMADISDRSRLLPQPDKVTNSSARKNSDEREDPKPGAKRKSNWLTQMIGSFSGSGDEGQSLGTTIGEHSPNSTPSHTASDMSKNPPDAWVELGSKPHNCKRDYWLEVPPYSAGIPLLDCDQMKCYPTIKPSLEDAHYQPGLHQSEEQAATQSHGQSPRADADSKRHGSGKSLPQFFGGRLSTRSKRQLDPPSPLQFSQLNQARDEQQQDFDERLRYLEQRLVHLQQRDEMLEKENMKLRDQLRDQKDKIEHLKVEHTKRVTDLEKKAKEEEANATREREQHTTEELKNLRGELQAYIKKTAGELNELKEELKSSNKRCNALKVEVWKLQTAQGECEQTLRLQARQTEDLEARQERPAAPQKREAQRWKIHHRQLDPTFAS